MRRAGGGSTTITRYYPFGGYRDGDGFEPITDRGFTGHRENRDIGLTYMNARYYVPSIARFASADTLVPDPENPQSFNRYAYTYNNPLRFTDPSGHRVCEGLTLCAPSPLPPPPIWERSPLDNPDWVQYYGFTEYSEDRAYNTNAGQHSGLDYGRFGQAFGGTWNVKTQQWEFDGTYGTPERPLIPVYAGCDCEVHSTSTGSSYAPGRINLTQDEYPGFLLIYGHLQDIQVTSGSVAPDTIIGYLETTERHLHLEIRRESDNYFVNPFNYLSVQLQVEMLSFWEDSSGTTYQPDHSTDPARQPPGYYE
jgi:RHS repeat-associated protein